MARSPEQCETEASKSAFCLRSVSSSCIPHLLLITSSVQPCSSLSCRSMQCVLHCRVLRCITVCCIMCCAAAMLQETLAAVSQHVEDWKSLLSAAGLDDKQASQFLHSSASKCLTACICSVLLLVLQYVIVCNFYPSAILCCMHFTTAIIDNSVRALL